MLDSDTQRYSHRTAEDSACCLIESFVATYRVTSLMLIEVQNQDIFQPTYHQKYDHRTQTFKDRNPIST
ncbi:MAG: hypothetical protein EZS28_035333 [Streblomastix strix]|uniref:Uncharacterized protein n=1 Tax=Streblomastix strix TaxID=222440 RepID=A0A5J4UGM1_9EUKA|nr:MAG: hypothetical protein EZS28_035333 [Streblomastix strix]